uniref:Uncharacterized protein n=1 Tax=Rhodococcus sp. NS1 TaxID=402236 RepID=A0A097SPT2_9NOCA|nr:hypothetical protein LRS1606.95 [Rhodococcus sp. NS1]
MSPSPGGLTRENHSTSVGERRTIGGPNRRAEGVVRQTESLVRVARAPVSDTLRCNADALSGDGQVHGPAGIRVGVLRGVVVKATVMKTIAAVGLMSMVLLMTGCSEAGDTNDAAPTTTTTTTSTASVSTPPSTTTPTTTSPALSTELLPNPAPVFPSTTAAVWTPWTSPMSSSVSTAPPAPHDGATEPWRSPSGASTSAAEKNICVRNVRPTPSSATEMSAATRTPEAPFPIRKHSCRQQSQQSTADKQIAWCGTDKNIYNRATTFYTDGTSSSWTQYGADQFDSVNNRRCRQERTAVAEPSQDRARHPTRASSRTPPTAASSNAPTATGSTSRDIPAGPKGQELLEWSNNHRSNRSGRRLPASCAHRASREQYH